MASADSPVHSMRCPQHLSSLTKIEWQLSGSRPLVGVSPSRLLHVAPSYSEDLLVGVLVALQRHLASSPCRSTVKTGPMRAPADHVDVLRRTATQTPEMASFPRQPSATSRLMHETHGANSISLVARWSWSRSNTRDLVNDSVGRVPCGLWTRDFMHTHKVKP